MIHCLLILLNVWALDTGKQLFMLQYTNWTGLVMPFNRQQQLLKSLHPSVSLIGIPLSLFPPPFPLCPVESQSPWEAGSGCREAAHISRQSQILCQKGDTFQTGPAIYHREPVFLPAPCLTPLCWKAARWSRLSTGRETNGLTSRIELVVTLRFLCTVAQWGDAT